MSESMARSEAPGVGPALHFALQPLLSDSELSPIDLERRQVLDRLVCAQAAQARAELEQLEAVLDLCELYRTNDAEEFCELAAERYLRLGGEGTPALSEFVCAEVAAALGCSQRSAAGRIVEALNLSFRHPVLYQAVKAGRIRVWQAARLMAESGTFGLGLAEVLWVDAQWGRHLGALSLGRLIALAKGLVARADAELAARRAEQARERRHAAVFCEAAQTVGEVSATLDLVDAVVLNHTIAALAEQLSRESDDSLDVRRAKALGILGTPGRALEMLRRSAAYRELVDTGVDVEVEPAVSSEAALRPRTTLVVHCTPDALIAESAPAESAPAGSAPAGSAPAGSAPAGSAPAGSAPADGVARIEGLGPVPVSQLRALLADSQVTVRPVVDHRAAPAVDRYEIPTATRAAVLNRTPHDAFPYSSIAGTRCDLDHAQPWTGRSRRGEPTESPPQTRVDNLTPLSRRAHRAKTHGGWSYHLTEDGYHLWRSPLAKHYLTGPHGTTSHDSSVECCVQLLVERWHE